jgi:SPRY domain
MVAIRLLRAVKSIAAFIYGRISRIIRHEVAHSTIKGLTMISSPTPNEKTKDEIAKQALSDYIANTKADYLASIRLKVESYSHHADITVIDTNTSIKVSLNGKVCWWRGLIWDKSIRKYSVKIDASTSIDVMIGFAPSILFDISTVDHRSAFNHRSCGWYLHLFSGSLYSQNRDHGKAYNSRFNVGDTLTCIYNRSSSEISFEKNGVSLGVAFTNVKGKDIAPAVELFYEEDSITLTTE